MQRAYVPEQDKTGYPTSCATKTGLGVDVVDVRTTKASQVEAPLPDVSELYDATDWVTSD